MVLDSSTFLQEIMVLAVVVTSSVICPSAPPPQPVAKFVILNLHLWFKLLVNDELFLHLKLVLLLAGYKEIASDIISVDF